MAARKQHTKQWVKTMQALRQAPKARHYRQNYHGRRVADLAEAVAQSLSLPQTEVATIRRAALLHDVGNVGVSDEVLLKPGPLTEAEFCQVKEHVDRGMRDVAAVEALADIAPIVRHHHEWVNGAGYPDRLSGDEIPIGARVVAAADAYVAMTANVPWRTPRSPEQAIHELRRSAGTQLDQSIVDHLVDVLRKDDAPSD